MDAREPQAGVTAELGGFSEFAAVNNSGGRSQDAAEKSLPGSKIVTHFIFYPPRSDTMKREKKVNLPFLCVFPHLSFFFLLPVRLYVAPYAPPEAFVAQRGGENVGGLLNLSARWKKNEKNENRVWRRHRR